jgi:type I restriction enzyme M protein
MAKVSETETVIKKIIPYLVRRGYDVEKDFTFEYPTAGSARANLGFVDIVVKHAGKIAFLVEAKRIAKSLAQKDRDQAVAYGKDCKAPFVVLTNGAQFESLSSATGKRIRWNGKLSDKIPSKAELPAALTALRKDALLTEVPLGGDTSLPFRPGLPLKQLNALFSRCHGTIRKIERNEDHAFADFAKLLFLKLLEEKADSEGTTLPYSYRFHELAEKPESEADQIRTAVTSMLDTVRSSTPYGDVIREKIHLKNSKTFQRIVRELAAVSFRDSSADSKGAAFEYFVRATLKGKKLGQYFTPRPLVDLMHAMIGHDKVLSTLSYGGTMRVVDPACGTGGFLVYLMVSALEQADNLFSSGKINASRRDELAAKVKQHVFFGADAHDGVASSAKMNMIIAGDGHSNIQCEDTLASASSIWNVNAPDIDLIITNPPFGTSESESMVEGDLDQFPVKGSKGQILFLQKMVQAVKPGGEICTVIDEGLLNTEQAAALRGYIMEHMVLKGIVRLPDVTFKPNKINVKSSVLHMEKRMEPKPDIDDDYPVLFVDMQTLGYQGSGEPIRGMDFYFGDRRGSGGLLGLCTRKV